MKQSPILGAVCACAISFATLSANASTLISNNFQRYGPSEQIIAPFTTSGGVQSVNTYSGLLEVVVSGVGNSLGTATNDAFYGIDSGTHVCVTEGAPIDSSCSLGPSYQLGVGFQGAPFSAYDVSDAENFITFIDAVGYVSPGTLPSYDSANHAYHFIIDMSFLNVSSSQVTFGVTDDFYNDNGGQYIIDIYQTQAVPLPPALWLFGTGLLGLVGVARGKRQTYRG
jgi:hypothetical protein